MTKTLILVRHGHRDNTDRLVDNGLSPKGKPQAKAIRRFFEQRYGLEGHENGLWIVSSPKLRCQETLLPLAKQLGRAVDQHPDLDEQSPRESVSRFESRVQGFLNEWTKGAIGITLACSHGDWLGSAVFHLLGLRQEMKKGAWLELEWESGRSYLKWYVPHFKPFYN